MQNPHERQQEALVRRIVGSVSRVNEVMKHLNAELARVEKYDQDIAFVSEMWQSYEQKAKFYHEHLK